jgi:hypothetical protein
MHPTEQACTLSREWAILQHNHEQHERNSLLVKLAGVALLATSATLALSVPAGVAMLLVLWLQEAIFRTFQARLGERILRIEQLLREGATQSAAPCQLHSEWLASRPGTAGLLAEYAKNMLRPTVAFPYAVLVLISLGQAALS